MVFGFMIFISESNQMDCKTELKRLSIESYEGEIIEKYIDSSNHMNEIILIKNDYGLRTLLCNNETSGLFEYLKVGDYISKKNGNYEVRIKRNEEDTIYNYRTYCHKEIEIDKKKQ